MMWLHAIEQNGLYILTGVMTGLLSGLLGVGGGIMVVPALLWIFEWYTNIPSALAMHLAAGSSMAVIVVTSIVAVRSHCRFESIQWWVYQRIWPMLLVGTLLGAAFATQLPTLWLQRLFAVFLLGVVYQMPAPGKVIAKQFPSLWVNRMVTGLIGVSSGLFGVGGGVLMVPYLTFCGIEAKRIPPISSLCTLTISTMGAVTLMSMTLTSPDPIPYTTGYVYWPAVGWIAFGSLFFAPLGAKWSYVLPPRFLRQLFVAIILLTVVGLLA